MTFNRVVHFVFIRLIKGGGLVESKLAANIIAQLASESLGAVGVSCQAVHVHVFWMSLLILMLKLFI